MTVPVENIFCAVLSATFVMWVISSSRVSLPHPGGVGDGDTPDYGNKAAGGIREEDNGSGSRRADDVPNTSIGQKQEVYGIIRSPNDTHNDPLGEVMGDAADVEGNERGEQRNRRRRRGRNGNASLFLGVSWERWTGSLILSLALGMRAWAKRHLSMSGLVTGVLIGMVSVMANFCHAASILAFFLTSSIATNRGKAKKRKIDASYVEGGKRNWRQAVSCAGVAAELAMVQLIMCGSGEKPVSFDDDFWHSYIGMAVLGSLACSNGDTWASELGTIVETTPPRLITNFRRVPKGTNGAVTLGGLVFSFLGGLTVGIAYYCALFLSLLYAADTRTPSETTTTNPDTSVPRLPPQWPILVVGASAGLFGSVVDSLLGATCQFTGLDESTGLIVDDPKPRTTTAKATNGGVKSISGFAILSNCGVNLASTLVSAIFAAELSRFLWPQICHCTSFFGIPPWV